jgi:hypothetical protein
MQATGLKRIHNWQTRAAVIVVLILASVGCGGGTTGTSSGDTFKFIGITEDAVRAPIADTEMSVRSGGNNQILVESQTDRTGDFAMDLPSDEESLVVDIQGTESAPLERQLLGESIVSTKLRQDDAGALSFTETFEVQVDTAGLCAALQVEEETIYQRSDPNDGAGQPCIIPFNVRAKDLLPSTIQASVQTDCAVSIQPAGVAPDGTISVDVASLLNSGCNNSEIIVSVIGSSLRDAVFYLRTRP